MNGNKSITEPYFPINTYISTAGEVCTQMTLEKWRGTLNAADLFAKGHCLTTIINLMID